MYGVGHAIQAGVTQEVFTACDMPSQFNTIDMLGLSDTALSSTLLAANLATEKALPGK